MRTLEKWFEPAVIVTMLGAIIVLVFADVVARFAFSTSVAVANEMARFCFVYMIYFGVSYAIRERRHMRVTVILDGLPRAWRRWTFALAEAVFLIYSVVVCWLGVIITQQSVDRGRIMSSTEWPLGVLYAAIILSGALSALRLAHSLWRVVRHGDDHLTPQQDI
ncbi:TRAP transporter small permease subunit [Maritimibacter sp. DP07]|jgi:TRAP-type C4-dicarboxylate transport system permease small subunit|uniref:TRAP transporter small permease protein n=1 Tax=Maritimibacter harenae TaxID=2606218 RepID=A0A845M2G8_9RHOB|nr:TRAP transporter small permease [Maritimibacter harenae]MZR14550.1 TRAP transporter small permease subunit [Maritimibacter harenae]